MDISDFTEQQVDQIVAEWVAFARTGVPESQGLTTEELADHAKVLLLAIAADIRRAQGAQQTHEKSQGNATELAPEVTRIARDHAAQRFSQGFSLDHLLAEFRALRASVIRRWMKPADPVTRDGFDQLTRFGESMDQALTESVSLYSAKVQDARNLLLGVLGHDLRNPLGAVYMTAEFLLESGTVKGAQAEAVARILRSAERMRAMVNDLLDFTQTSLGVPMPVSPRPGDLGDLAADIVRELNAIHPDRTITVTREGDLTGSWDPERIGQMLSNLVGNALQHSDGGTPVSVDVAQDGAFGAVRVRNEGAPISEDARKTLFFPLRHVSGERIDKQAGSSGLGLGLYIAREIAVAHGGSIELTCEDGAITFCARLPREPWSSARSPAHRAQGSVAGP
jgi:signal transduction histidine kinase